VKSRFDRKTESKNSIPKRDVVFGAKPAVVIRYWVAIPPVVGGAQSTNQPKLSPDAEALVTGPGGRAITPVVVVVVVGARVVGGAVGATVVVGAAVVVVVGGSVVVGGVVVVVVVVVTGGVVVGATVVVGAIVVVVVGATVVVVVVVVFGGVGLLPSAVVRELIGPAPIGPMASTVKVNCTTPPVWGLETVADVDAVVRLSPKLVVIL
jgi:hypothetical protein